MNHSLLLLLLLSCFSASAQNLEIVHLRQDGSYAVESIKSDVLPHAGNREGYNQLPGFPFSSPAHPNFKNFRNVSIADLDDDGREEILVCLNETLFAINHDGSIHWQVQLEGTSNYPPAIADIDGDGDLEIALQTYGIPATGNIYLLDHSGKLEAGWPINIDNNFFLNGITLADLDGDESLEIIACERINSNFGRVHALRPDGTSFSTSWPISIPGTPAFTPSVADINADGKVDLITCTTSALYAFSSDGNELNGFPLAEEGTKFSYQSPLLVDLDGDDRHEIVTARHGEVPGTMVVTSDGSYYGEWPDVDNNWTFSTPAVVDIDEDGDYEVFYSRPHLSETMPDDVVLGYDHEGKRLDDFQVIDLVGSEGLLAIADIDNDGDQEIITASKASIDGMGLIHAYHYESGAELSNFPLFVEGFTFLNGAYLSDVDNDGNLDLTAISYQLKFDQANPDSAFINVYDMQVPYDQTTILFNGYKGGSTHDGLINKLSSSVHNNSTATINLFPNPAQDILYLSDEISAGSNVKIYDYAGNLVLQVSPSKDYIDLKKLHPGTYFLKKGGAVEKFVKL